RRAVQRGRGPCGLSERPTACGPRSGQRVPSATAKAGGAVAVGNPDRAEQPKIVEVKHGAGARLPGGLECAPAEQRMDVVRVDDIGAEPANRCADLIWIKAARGQAMRRAGT